ncbi:hypothetical protein JG688_00010610 [Phytophthora aleatoria]|uniref:Uncharacterized protein n=1 Tax=Phytophthora aleatoria TaxID=2496075 RepID=A0A8J5MF11_9STRA|nr:hypothetical protein JG688_00010610 [Phytophthora aleatoria]
MNSNATAVSWYPQKENKPTSFLNFTFLDQSTYSNGACSILDSNGPECILMTGHQGGVSAYGLCRNGSEFVSVQYVQVLVTPADIGGLVASGTWVENGRESVFVGMSGAFVPADKGPTTQWFDLMDLPASVRERMFYLVAKQGTGQGLTIPSKKRQSFDRIIASNTFGSTLADKLEIATPYIGSKYVNVILYRIAGASIALPRLQFTFAVAAQALALLVFMILINARNGALNTYHLVQQLLRLPTFCIIALQLVYVLYYQVFDIMYLSGNSNSTLRAIYDKKIVYVAGVSFILLHQLDYRQYRHEYEPADKRAPDQLTSFEGYGCGGPLGNYYYYNTLLTQTRADGSTLFLTCSKAVRDEGFVLLGGSEVLIRAKDLYIIMGMKLFTEKMASTINLSVVLAHIVNGHLTPMRRVSYITLYLVSRRWDGRISYPDIS